ncbi:ORF6N domain-containing protein, partial [Escherichia coli]
MKTLPTVNTLQPILHNQIPVITTELLAQLYGAEVKNIQNNYARNAERFVEGKHFFKVAGDELKTLRVTLSHSQNLQPSLRGLQIPPKVRSLILWTERGAARHAKMLETNQAWDVFERLEDSYFNQNAQTAATVTVSPNNAREVVDTLNAKPMYYVKV